MTDKIQHPICSFPKCAEPAKYLITLRANNASLLPMRQDSRQSCHNHLGGCVRDYANAGPRFYQTIQHIAEAK